MLRIGFQLTVREVLASVCTKAVPRIVNNVNLQLRVNQSVRDASFFNKVDADLLWKSWTSVSNAGKKRGRGQGRGKKFKKNLYTNSNPKVGKEKIVFPGWHTLIQKGDAKIPQVVETQPEEKPVEAKQRKPYKTKIHPLERGWSGNKLVGKKIGPPELEDGEILEGFESIVIEHKMVSHMTKLFGKVRHFTTFVITGNGNGVIGMGIATKLDVKANIKLAKSRAAKRLVTIDLEKPGAVNYSFTTQFGNTKITVFKKSPGFGLKCHRAIKACCELLGINDIHVRVEGPMNYKHIVRGFIYGLLQQKPYQQIAEESKLYLVEQKKEEYFFPKLLGKPEKTKPEIDPNKVPLSFEEYVTGKLYWKYWKQPRPPPFYQRLPSWEKHLKRTLYKRNHDQVKYDLVKTYGELKSHLCYVYPECTSPKALPKKVEETTEDSS